MESDLEKDKAVEQSKQAVQQDAKGLFKSIKKFLFELFDFRHDTDYQATIEAIKNDIPFKGATAWVLIFAIFVASVGLNANSTAVVIGAMLISPLMGPILGIGMSIAINDIDTLRKSIINLTTMIVLSLLTSFLFFRIFPLSQDNSELLGRVSPDIRDVLIAFFGGLALMVARTKKGTIASVIFGVAIATALMPPLCTAGYGLAKGNSEYFLGALYLFTINTIFIGLATFLVSKLLGFPMLRYANSAKRRRIAQIASLLAIVVMIPATFTFIRVYKENVIQNQIKSYINEHIKSNSSLQLISYDLNLSDKTLSLSFFNEITDATKNFLYNNLTNTALYPNLTDFKLNIKGSDTKSYDLISGAYKDAREQIKESKNIISGLQKKIDELEQEITYLKSGIERDTQKNNIFNRLVKESKIRYNNIEKIAFAKLLYSDNFIDIDTVPLVKLLWNKNLSDSIKNVKEKEFKKWLQKSLSLDTLIVERLDK